MKAFFALIALTLAVPALAQTMEARLTKAEMVRRTIDLENHAKEGRRLFKELKLKEGCAEVDYLFKHTYEHMDSVLHRMNAGKKKIYKMQDKSVELMQDIRDMNRVCKSEGHLQVDPEIFADNLKGYAKVMKRHRNLIEDNSVEYRNGYDVTY